jgi:hypothetical protein
MCHQITVLLRTLDDIVCVGPERCRYIQTSEIHTKCLGRMIGSSHDISETRVKKSGQHQCVREL